MREDKPRILVVDDLDEHRDLLAQVLEDLGYDVVEARDGAAALRLVRADPRLRLVLLDLFMPGMDGHAFLQALRADGARKGLPVVLMTADPDAAEAWPGAARPDLSLVKPFGLRELRQVVVRFCGQGVVAPRRPAPRKPAQGRE